MAQEMPWGYSKEGDATTVRYPDSSDAYCAAAMASLTVEWYERNWFFCIPVTRGHSVRKRPRLCLQVGWGIPERVYWEMK